MSYRVIEHPNVTPAVAKLAPQFQKLEDAFKVSGTGLVIDENDRVISFYKRHLAILQAGRTAYRP